MNLSIVKPTAPAEESVDFFETVARKPNLAGDVVRQIEDAIIRGRLKPNDRLPAERDLCRQFGVSRTVIREALHVLSTKNLIEMRPGAGTVVREPTTQTISESISLLLNIGRSSIKSNELVEVRRCLEIEIAALAAERRTDEDLKHLTQCIEPMDQAQTNEQFVESDMAFHQAMAAATQNRLYLVLLNSIIEVIYRVSILHSSDPNIRARALNYHRQLLDNVLSGDAEGAATIMRNHLLSFAEISHKTLGSDNQE